ncbi:MAG: TIGR01459 family HAD-type hydrolase [Cohaesibacteraceae bacterium]
MADPTSLLEVADPYEVIVLDQWGVLHNGSTPYPGAARALNALASSGKRLAVLSNSGKRAAPNAKRIADIGLPIDDIELTMTSGEACWQDYRDGKRKGKKLLAITGRPGDALAWADGLDVSITDTLETAEAVLLMGIPEGSKAQAEQAVLDDAFQRGLPVVCTNPDRASPRADGVLQVSPGTLAHAYEDRGGDVIFYGKPHRPVFERLLQSLGARAEHCLMVGDSMEHDIAGAQGIGMASAFVTSGLHASEFEGITDASALAGAIASAQGLLPPDHVINRLG